MSESMKPMAQIEMLEIEMAEIDKPEIDQRLRRAQRGGPQRAIADFVRGFSLEATRPSAAEIEALAATAPPGTRVYLSAIPTRPPHDVIEGAARLAAAGFEPVPHVAARMFATARALDQFLARLGAEAGVRRVLLIAGDRDEPAGEFHSALELIDGGMLQRRGITEIGIAGYPEGHPRLSVQELDLALLRKVAAADATGIKVHVVTQFCFDAGAIVSWIGRLRGFGLELPVRVGLAGPTSIATLLRYAGRCGVRASAQGLARQAGLVKHLFAISAPDALLRALAQARPQGDLGEVVPHFYSFGGLGRTARWAQAVAKGQIALQGGEGFAVGPDA
jgi:methylenetetrahydrofolate reductase (NADPH)